MTNREFVSEIESDLKSLNKDMFIPRRYILKKAMRIAETYMAQRLDSNDLYNDISIITEMPCVEMESFSGISCGIVELRGCSNVMKSKCELPKILGGRLTYGIFSVFNLDNSYEFKPTTTALFQQKMKNKYVRDKEKFYIIKDKYIYLPNSEVSYIKIEAVVLDKKNIEDCFCDKKDKEKNKKCSTLWDNDFVCPKNILSMVKDKAVQEIVSTRFQIKEDENPNLDENIRGQVTKTR